MVNGWKHRLGNKLKQNNLRAARVTRVVNLWEENLRNFPRAKSRFVRNQ